ncbi:MAG: hypothetical protein A2010_04435 [Nitrospirae bacterium GWD2_57_9]|nr:MAG: hypothetical protein A2010_04435 [Nitrospirae bacterium GWD2_57_9]
MRLNDPLNIMLSCCIPDKKRLMEAISRLRPGEVLRVEIDNCVASRAMVESYLKNKWCRIEHVIENERTSILHIRLDVSA